MQINEKISQRISTNRFVSNRIITVIVWRFNHKQTFMTFVDVFCPCRTREPKLMLDEKLRVPKTFEQ
jgi:hypothetical protein